MSAATPSASPPRFALGSKSVAELSGVHPSLVAVVRRAIEITAVDFAVHDGLRTPLEQAALVVKGASKTQNSKHLPQHDGYGHAVDLVPVIGGKLRWEWQPIYAIATAVQQAAREQGVRIRWGGVWDRALNDLGDDLKTEVAVYCSRHPGPDFIDGPHYEIAS